MKLTFVALAAFMTIAAPVFAEEIDLFSYRIKIDKDSEYEKILENNKEIFKQLENKNLFSKWLKDPQDIPENAKDVYKKPSFFVNVEEHNKKINYIKCEETTPTN
tara:strand:- start:17 stop:331 length:315 start_codon:yes stop_codon:yes gene_type:complete